MRFLTFVLLTILISQFVTLSPVFGSTVSDPSIYPLPNCAVCDKALDEVSDPTTLKHDGRELRFCGKKCKESFKENPSPHLMKLDQSIIDDQLPFYPISSCLVSGEDFGGDMGEPANYLHKNRLIRFCCMGCLSSFNKKPDAYIAKLDEAVITAQLENYPADTCPVAGEKLGGMGEPYNYVFAGRLVRFCCGGCIGGFNSNPATALAEVYGHSAITK
jgi:YHS domain-containing protein